jgi:hypothetical protein
MSAVCLHKRALRAIEQRLDALLQAKLRPGFSRSISDSCGQMHFWLEATDDWTAACVSFDSGVYYECTSGAVAIKAFFDTKSANAEYNARPENLYKHTYLSYSFSEDGNTITLSICGEGKPLNFEKAAGTWVDQRNRPFSFK